MREKPWHPTMLGKFNFDIFFVSVAGSLLFLIFVVFIASMVALFTKRRQQQRLQLEQMRHSYEQMISQSQLEIQEQTFKNIAQEIHDNIGQMLSLAKLQLHSMSSLIGPEKVQDTTGLLSNALQDLRNLSKSLHPDRIGENPLAASMQYELDLLQRTGRVKTSLAQQDDGPDLTSQQRIVLFRIFQEMMSNTIKHANAKSFDVVWQNDGQRLHINMKDDGRGFSTNTASNGLGLTSMRQRANLIGASLSIVSSPGQGTSVDIVLPHTQPSAA